MKVLFIEARKKSNKTITENIARKLPTKLHILYTIQYKSIAEKLKKKLEKNHQVLAFQQVLGCSKIKPQASLLLVGSGRFHALTLPLNKKIFIYEEWKIKEITNEIQAKRKKERAKLTLFLASEKIGLLFSIKPGQDKLKLAEKIKKRIEKKFPGKNFYSFVSDNILINELENFPIDFWINTACPGIELDSNKILNYEKVWKIKNLLKE